MVIAFDFHTENLLLSIQLVGN